MSGDPYLAYKAARVDANVAIAKTALNEALADHVGLCAQAGLDIDHWPIRDRMRAAQRELDLIRQMSRDIAGSAMIGADPLSAPAHGQERGDT